MTPGSGEKSVQSPCGRRSLVRRPIAALICALPLMAALAPPAKARADLRSSQPAAQAVLAVSPQEVVLTFSQAVEPAYSFIAVLDGNGRRIDVGHMERDPKKAGVVHVPLFGKAQGDCRVNWRMVGTDGRTTNGSFTFAVAP